ncbi:MAG: GntR family transcriptional regulator [Micromonosporaceae bacterium]
MPTDPAADRATDRPGEGAADRGADGAAEQATGQPAYLRIAADLRAQISSGELPPGTKLPSEAQLMRRYGVSNTIIKNVRQILVSEGLVEARKGSGVYVLQEEPRPTRRSQLTRDRQPDRISRGSPFARDAAQAGYRATWEFHSQRIPALPAVAARLSIKPDDDVMYTRYRFMADNVPIMLSESWEPVAITGGTPIEWPEYEESGTASHGDHAPVGVVARMDSIGVPIEYAEEEVTDRAATPDEIERLKLPPTRTGVLHIQRTYYAAGDRPVETADIVLPGRRYRLHYRIPIT